MRYHIITFGCQMNQSDSERIAAVLESMSYRSATLNVADLIVVNMCSVRQSAVDRVLGLIPKFKKLRTKKSNLKTVLTGCILKKDRRKFAKEFNLIFNIKDLDKLPKILNTKYPILNTKSHFKIQPKHLNDFSILIPISNGCNNFCSYCVVPFTRGPLICRDHKEVLKEVKNVINQGSKEIWLLGQNVNDYYSPTDSSINFPKLLKMANNIPGNFWIRFTSSHPKDFSDELIDSIAESEKVTEYVNLPVQSGDDEILKNMNRPYTVSQYKRLVKKIREAIPNVCLSTDVIVGFPKETKKQFENTVWLFKEIKFDMAYISKYSPRPQTAALKIKDNIPQKEKKRRKKILTEVLRKTALENNKKYIGKTIDVLTDKSKNGFLTGKTRTYKTVKFEAPENLVGQFKKVKIVDALPWGLKGKLI